MYCTSTHDERCPPRGKPVAITLSQDVEGGYGCALAMEEPERACALQDHCPHAHREGCLLDPH